jgi:hypothetical protein
MYILSALGVDFTTSEDDMKTKRTIRDGVDRERQSMNKLPMVAFVITCKFFAYPAFKAGHVRD